MLGLGEYESSSEDEVERKAPPLDSQPQKDILPESSQPGQNEVQNPIGKQSDIAPSSAPTEANGPVLGPASMEMMPSEDKDSTNGRTSPFSASRALIQDLTLPPVPNLDIPPSPPGSPNPAVNANFEHFLNIKKQGVHFNSKLASSSSLRNPSLLLKLMEHAGVDEQSQYDTSLPAELWNPSNLPEWGFKEELLRTQQQRRKNLEEKKASGQRTSVDFVAGSA
ncbi:uncharacterized protein N7515_006200 [Penicillium bovifimosum]|uniref:Uncharacterized protein n=1 Tax=Penicillium bovifimosum TaxID=126998 RepID=A0A9W9L0I6_9EURO|nr:uncharacterized protein N7515_006200 [Penicillium bovifimosum]KAJ5130161.1 hypothetical protein N7515_006200 [Penicillium bovifimosum]